MKVLKILVSYVIREEDGISPAKEFLGSLQKFPAGAAATLLVSVKCRNPIFLDQIRGIFEAGVKEFDIDVVRAPDHGFDLGSHYLIARQNPGSKGQDPTLAGAEKRGVGVRTGERQRPRCRCTDRLVKRRSRRQQ